MIQCVIPGEPVSQGRGRAVRFGNRVRVVDPKKSRSWKGAAQVHMLESRGDQSALDGPLRVTIRAFWPSIKPPRKTKPRPAVLRPKKPDGDNVAKAVLDAGNGILWADDAQVVDLRIEKWHAAQGDDPRVEIEVEEVAC